jgi:hypothetical protein
MQTDEEKRACDRHGYAADIAFSYFNQEHYYGAQILNLGAGGMCFKSNLRLQPGTAVYIRIKKIHPNSAGSARCDGLRSVALAEVKWCSELPDATIFPYGVGVKYFNPVY